LDQFLYNSILILYNSIFGDQLWIGVFL